MVCWVLIGKSLDWPLTALSFSLDLSSSLLVVQVSGEWCNGQSHGVGVQTCSDGSYYIGELKYGTKHGLGCYHLRSVLRFLISTVHSTVHSIAAKLRDREKHQEPFRM
ncbi:hypothetical protein ACFX11_039629 [Malus domestica]